MRHELARVGPVVADVMIRYPKLCGLETTVGQARAHLADDHVHALLVTHDGVLVTVVERDDLAGAAPEEPIWPLGRLGDRVVGADADLAVVSREMSERGLRRLAVVDGGGQLAGLLCRKRSGQGFCSDDGVAARAAGRAVGLDHLVGIVEEHRVGVTAEEAHVRVAGRPSPQRSCPLSQST